MPFDPDRVPPPDGMKATLPGGYIVAGRNEWGSAVILEMHVDERQRRAGVGRQLVEAVRTWARQQGLERIIVECSPRNETGQAFYEALGMRAVSITYQQELD